TGLFDFTRIERDALDWLEALPARYRDEIVAIAVAAEVPLATMAQCQFSAYALVGDPLRACSSLVLSVEGHTWVAHNTDWLDAGSRAWTTAVMREMPGAVGP